MRVYESAIHSRDRRRFAVLFFAALASLITIFALPLQGQAPRSIGSAIPADGGLDPSTLPPGSYDASSFRLQLGDDGSPRFMADTGNTADEYWDDRFGFPGVNSHVHAVATAPNGDIYVAGEFQKAGAVEALRIARWDGRRFHPLGTGLDGTAHSLAIAPDGMVYAAGMFARAGGTLVRGVARWDGTAWHALGTGVTADHGNPIVYAVAVHGSKVYIGGEFDRAGGKQAVNLAVWDGQTWSDVGGGLGDIDWEENFLPGGEVYALAVNGNDLYVGGRFKVASNKKVMNGIARWDGSQWHSLATGFNEHDDWTSARVRAILVANGRVYAGGIFSRAAETEVNAIAYFHDGKWNAMSTGMTHYYDGAVSALVRIGESIYASGYFLNAGSTEAQNIARWDGAQWHAVDKGAEFSIDALAVTGSGELVAAGSFLNIGNVRTNHVGVLKNGKWAAFGQGVTSGYAAGIIWTVAVTESGDVYIGGSFDEVGGRKVRSVARWDGTEWHPLGDGPNNGTNHYVHVITASGNDVYIGGRFTEAGGTSANRIVKYNRATNTFSPLGNGVNGYINAIAVTEEYVYAGGSFTSAGTVSTQGVARWNGFAWSALDAPIEYRLGDGVFAIEVIGKYVFVGGDFDQVKFPGQDFAIVQSLFYWDSEERKYYSVGGVFRNAGGSDVWGRVRALKYHDGLLYVGGLFDKVGTVAANGVAILDFQAGWAPVGSGIGGGVQPHVRALAVVNGHLVAAGEFESAGGHPARYVARWNGTEWVQLGSGLHLDGFTTSAGYGVAGDGEYVYVGGYFLTAGSKPSSSFGIYRHGVTETPAPRPHISVSFREYDFGDIPVDDRSAPVEFTVTNAAGAEAQLNGNLSTLGDFSIVEGAAAFSLAPGASHTVRVEFQPKTGTDHIGKLVVNHNARNENTPINVALTGRGVQGVAPVISLRHFQLTEQQTTITVNEGGFLFGTNKYLDRAKGVAFTIPDENQGGYQLTEIKIWFAFKRPGLSTQLYRIKIYEGTPDFGPVGEPLFSEGYLMKDVNADADLSTPEGPTTHRFNTPLWVPADFFVMVEFEPYTVHWADMLGIVSTGEVHRRVPEVWERDAELRWYNVSDAWAGGTMGWQPWIESILTRGGTSTEPERELPDGIALHQNFPNPFNPTTQVSFDVPSARHVTLRVFNVLGQEVATLVDRTVEAGRHVVPFEAGSLPSGVYMAQIEAGTQIKSIKMMLAK